MRTGIQSGAKWYKSLPEDWEERKIQYSANVFSGGTPDRNNLDYWENGTVPWLTSGEINKGTITFADSQITEIAVKETSTRWASRQSILIALNGQGKTKATVALLEFDSTINQSLCCIQPNKEHYYRFIFYYLKSKYEQIRGLVGEDRDGLNLALIKSVVLPLPSISIQQSIAAYLDKETVRIDALIAKKERQLELLKEKRQAIITRAITKGLDPNAKMKDSGVEWIGEIPEGWLILPLKRLVRMRITDGPHETPEILEDGIPFISAEAIKNNKIDFSKKRGFIEKSEHERFCKKYKPKRDDIYMIKSGATTGNMAMVETDEEFSIWSPLAAIRADNKKIIPRYLFYSMLSNGFRVSVELFWSYGTQQNIGMGVIENLVVAVPPLAEQTKILAFISQRLPSIDLLSDNIRQSIDMLWEYRSSLITAAVSGQINVSQEVAP